MSEQAPDSAWRGERTTLLEEIEKYYRLYESNAFADQGAWKFWVVKHPRFATYWQWQRSLPNYERYQAIASGDHHLLNIIGIFVGLGRSDSYETVTGIIAFGLAIWLAKRWSKR